MVQNMQIPEDIRADNPNAKIVFALRYWVVAVPIIDDAGMSCEIR